MSATAAHARRELNTSAIAHELSSASDGVRLPDLLAAALADLIDAVDMVYLDVGLHRLGDARADIEILALTSHLVVHACVARAPLDGAAHTLAPDIRIWPMARVASVSINGARSHPATDLWGESDRSGVSGPTLKSVTARFDDGAKICFPLAEHNRAAASVAIRMLLTTV